MEGERLDTARALLLGQAHRMTEPHRNRFTETGLAHLLAVSGLHTGFMLLIVLALSRVVGLGPHGCAWVGMVSVVLYAGLTGFRPPVVRASTMAVFILAALTMARYTSSLAALATAAFVTLLVDPRNILRVDWQLSYVCVLSIILLTGPIYAVLPGGAKSRFLDPAHTDPEPWWRPWVRYYLVLPVAVVLAVQLGLIPFQLYYFRQFNWLAPITNTAGLALTLAGMTASLATATLGWIPGLGKASALASDAALAGLNGMARWIHDDGLGMLHMRPLGIPALGIYYALLLGGGFLRTGRGEHGGLDGRQRASLFIRTAGMVALLVWAPRADRSDQGLDLYMLDVGQGDALVVRAPTDRVMVVDAGAGHPLQAGRNVVAPFLQCIGRRRIDCLVATHADADHIGGMPYLVRHFEIGLMLEGPDQSDSQVYQALLRQRQDRPIQTRRVRSGHQLDGFEPVEIRLLGPPAGVTDGNNASLVILLTLGEVKILLAGDLEASGEAKLLRPNPAGDIDVLKVGHHGSASGTTREWLQALRPEVALISAGRNNPYGHPAPEVIERLKQARALPCRTDRQGAIWVHTQGQRIRVFRFAGQE